MIKRRNLVKSIGAAGIVSTLPLTTLGRGADPKKLNVLFMGGTGFIGPHIVRAVVAQGHTVTLFNRGKSDPSLFSDLELIKGDRNTSDMQQVSNRRWDLIVDTSCYLPRSVELLMSAVDQARVQQYVFISTISVYQDFSAKGLDEQAELATMDDPSSEDIGKHYGALKVLCEQAAEQALPGKVTKVRCGVIVGPGDSTDRFTYWPERIVRGGEVLAPGDGAQHIQTLDVRDLADWVGYCLEHNIVGAYNATHPAGTYSFAQMLELCQKTLNPDARLTWVAEDFLLDNKVQEMSDLPFWVAENGPMTGIWYVNSTKASANGLKHRPLEETIVDLHKWFQSLPEKRRNAMKTGMSAVREQELLAKWHTRQLV